ncbi:MAG: type II secretion system F family protein [archaeon]
MGFIEHIVKAYPDMKKKLRMAYINMTPEKYIKKQLRNSFLMSVMLTVLWFFLVDKKDWPMILVFVGFIVIFFGIYTVLIRTVDARISKRARNLDQDVLFAGRFLLVKLNSGKPLLNSLVDASKSYGVARTYFQEIVREIELGAPLEEALSDATEYCPSKNFKKILFQITNALKIGVDVTQFLDAVLEEISHEQLVEIQKYGKKLNGLTLFYMLLAIVLPSLGVTLFSVVASLLSVPIDVTLFIGLIIFLVAINFIFITIFKSARPVVNI